METCSNYHLLAFDWFIRNGIECCMRVGRVQNSDEKYLFRRLSVSGPSCSKGVKHDLPDKLLSRG